MMDLAAAENSSICLLHMQGEPRTMQQQPEYKNPVQEIKAFLQRRAELAEKTGIKHENMVISKKIFWGA